MKNFLLFAAALFLLFSGCRSKMSETEDRINPLIGDISFLEKFGYLPDASTDDKLRIRTHLEYVENLLRRKDCHHLSPELQTNREHLLDLFHDYWTAGIFPLNEEQQERRPCFIDGDGRICAVGYLVEQTAGRNAAEKINADFQYEELLDMHGAMLDQWIAQSGFTKEELATIQPMYGERRSMKKDKSQVVFYGGQSYRGYHDFFNTYDLSYELYGISGRDRRRRPTNGKFWGFGLRLDDFNQHGYSIGARYFKSPFESTGIFFNGFFSPYLGISPVFFNIYHKTGFNIKPEAGVRLNLAKAIGLSFNISYGYDIPVISETAFVYARHDLAMRLGLSTDFARIKKYFQKKKAEKKKEEEKENEEKGY